MDTKDEIFMYNAKDGRNLGGECSLKVLKLCTEVKFAINIVEFRVSEQQLEREYVRVFLFPSFFFPLW